jgi:hypothetical protein
VRRLDLENLHNPILRSLFCTTGINVPTPMSIKLIKTLDLLIESESGEALQITATVQLFPLHHDVHSSFEIGAVG